MIAARNSPCRKENAVEPSIRRTDPEAKARFVPRVTYTIVAGCVVIFLFLNFGKTYAHYGRIADFLIPNVFRIWGGAYWGFLTSAFVHVEFWHILFNMWWAAYFGAVLERTLGRPRFVALVASSAVIASGAQLAFSGQTGIGFSGVLYALFGYMYAARAVDERYRFVVTRRTIVWLLGWLVLCIFLTAAKIMNIGNAAHIAGFMFGFFVGHVFAVKTYVKTSTVCIALLAGLTVLSATYMPWSEMWPHRAQAFKFIRAVGGAKAGDAEAQYYHAHVLMMQDRKDEALEWLRKSAEQDYAPAMNDLAWVLATDKEDRYRNGAEALQWAEKACEKDEWRTATFIDTLAAAYAELDRWDEAVATQEKAVAAAKKEEAVDPQRYIEVLASYKDRVKIRE